MRFTIDPIIFTKFPDFNAGVVAMKGIDNLVPDRDIEAFLRHASLEAALLLKLKPLASDHGVRTYREALAACGAAEAVPAMEAVLRELGEAIAKEQAAAGEAPQRGPGSVAGLIGDTALPRVNAAMDLVRGAEIQFRLPVFAFDMGDEAETLASGTVRLIIELKDLTAPRRSARAVATASEGGEFAFTFAAEDNWNAFGEKIFGSAV